MPQIITDVRALQIWVYEKLGTHQSPRDVWRIAEAIMIRPDRPDWGQDWQPYLDGLPENLYTLLEE